MSMSTTTAPLVATSPTPTLVDMDEATQPSQRSSFEQQYHASTQMDSKSVPALSEVVETKEDTSHIEGMKLIIVIVGLTVVVFLIMIDLSIVSTAIPQITSDFHRLEDVGWYVSAYQLSSAALQPLTGKLYTYLSSKWVFIFLFVIFELGSLICAIANSSTMFIIGRAIAGTGSSGIANGSLTIIARAVPLDKLPLYTGFVLGIGQIGILLGPLLGGVFTQYVTWRWCFYINLPLGGLAGIMLLFINIPDQTIKQPFSARLIRGLITKLDLPGLVLFAPAAIMFLLALQLGSSSSSSGGGGGWGSPQIIGLFCGAGVMAILFYLWEYRVGDAAMMPLSILRQRVVWASMLHSAFLLFATIGGSNFLPIYFQSVKGLGPTMSGIYMLPSIGSQLIAVIGSGILVTKLGYYLPWAFAAGVGTTIGFGLMTTFTPWTSLGKIIGYQIIYGIRGAGLQMGFVAIQSTLPPEQGAIGIGVIIFFQQFLSAVLITVANTIFQVSLASDVARLAPSVSPEEASAAGGSADAVRALLPPGSPELDGLLLAYSNSVGKVFYMLVGAAIMVCAASLGMGWVDLRKKKVAVVEGKEKGDAAV